MYDSIGNIIEYFELNPASTEIDLEKFYVMNHTFQKYTGARFHFLI